MRLRVRTLVSALLFACALAPATAAQDDFKAMRDRARKANSPGRWLELAEASRVPPPEFLATYPGQEVPRDWSKKTAPQLAIFREALGHLDPLRLAALAAAKPDSDINAAMVLALRALGRDDEAGGECNAAVAPWSGRLVEACKNCCYVRLPMPAGPASHSVFRQWLVLPAGDAGAYEAGLKRGLFVTPWMPRMKLTTLGERDDPRFEGMLVRREPFGVVVADPAESRGARAAALAAAFGMAYVALGPSVTMRDSTRSAVMLGERALVPRPGPDALARALLDAARRQGARKLALVVPGEGGDLLLAHALGRAAGASALPVTRIEYVAGRREHREDARRVRASGADAVALLGPAEESADWLPALRAGGGAVLVLGTDELDPAGFHEQARRAAEGAIFVRTRYSPVDTSATEWDGPSSAAWIAGWAVGNAIAHGADSPRALVRALETRVPEEDASNAWLAVPPEVAKIDVLRVRNGRAELLR